MAHGGCAAFTLRTKTQADEKQGLGSCSYFISAHEKLDSVEETGLFRILQRTWQNWESYPNVQRPNSVSEPEAIIALFTSFAEL